MRPSLRSTALSPLLLLLSATSLFQTVQAQCCQDNCANLVGNLLGPIQCILFGSGGLNLGSLPAQIVGNCPLGLLGINSACTCITASSSFCSSISSASAAAARTRTTTTTTTTTTRTTTTPALPAATTTTTTTVPTQTPSTTTPPLALVSTSSRNPFYVFTVTTPGFCSVSMVLYLTQITTYLPVGIATTVVPSPSQSSSLEFGCSPLTSTVIVFESSVTLGLGDTATVLASAAPT